MQFWNCVEDSVYHPFCGKNCVYFHTFGLLCKYLSFWKQKQLETSQFNHSSSTINTSIKVQKAFTRFLQHPENTMKQAVLFYVYIFESSTGMLISKAPVFCAFH